MNKAQSETYRWFLAHGEGRPASMGGATNAYVVARDTGRMPSWCAPGSVAKAAAWAGLRVRARKANPPPMDCHSENTK